MIPSTPCMMTTVRPQPRWLHGPAWLLACSGVLAQNVAKPLALEGIAPAGSMCARHEGGGVAARAPGAHALELAPDLSCLLSVTELARRRDASDLVVIDVRQGAQAALAQGAQPDWPGAMRMDATAVATKIYLQDRQVVLLGSGIGQQALLVQCARLKQRGFKSVRVANGGMPQWLYHEGMQADGTQSTEAMPTLSATMLWAESTFSGNLVLGRQEDGLTTQLPFALGVKDWSVASVRAAIDKRRRELKGVPLASIVLVMSPDGALGGTELEALRRAVFPVPLLGFTDTAPHLRAQLAQQEAVWRARDQGPRLPPCGQ